MKIGTVGSATQDIFILYEGAETLHLHTAQEVHSYLILEQGTKVDVPTLHYATGGGATNTAVGFKRLGLDVQAFFKVGKKDHASVEVLADMKAENIDISQVTFDEKTQTAVSFIIPSLEKNHVVFCYRGANKHLKVEDFPLQLLNTFDYLYINPLSEKSRLLLPYLARQAHALQIPVAVNPGMGQLVHEVDDFIEALQHVNILILNAYEAGHLMKAFLKEPITIAKRRPHQDQQTATLLKNFITVQGRVITLFDFFQELFKCGPSIIAVTNGIEGVYVATKDTVYFQPSIATTAISGLGAGDAFSSAFVGSLALGYDIPTAMLYGVINASSVIEQPDAKKGLLTLEQLEKKSPSVQVSNLQIKSFR